MDTGYLIFRWRHREQLFHHLPCITHAVIKGNTVRHVIQDNMSLICSLSRPKETGHNKYRSYSMWHRALPLESGLLAGETRRV